MDSKFKFKKSLGQNFLIDENIINKIVSSACIDKDTLVIEIGPGEGAISRRMAPLAKYLLCYEIDTSLKDKLDNIVNENNNVIVKYGDFLKASVSDDIKDYDYKKKYVVANLPYYITTAIINKVISDEIMPDKMLVMVQKEVADRFVAKPNSKNYNSLTVYLNYYYDICKLFDVSSNCFIPRPKVCSTVVEFVIKKDRPYVKDMEVFNRLVRDSFRYKRKTLRNNLAGYNMDKVMSILSKYNFDLSVRAEQIPLEIFVEIANSL